MKNKKILGAVLVICLLFAAVITAAYFLNGNSPAGTVENGMSEPQATETSEPGKEAGETSERKNMTEKFARYIDFSQDGMGTIAENGEYVNAKYRFVLHVPEIWHGNYRADVLDMTNENAVVAYISLMYTFKGNEELLGKIVIADKETWETWEESQMMTMPEVMMRSSDKSIVYGIYTADENPMLEGTEAYDKFEAMCIRDVQTAKELFALTTD